MTRATRQAVIAIADFNEAVILTAPTDPTVDELEVFIRQCNLRAGTNRSQLLRGGGDIPTDEDPDIVEAYVRVDKLKYLINHFIDSGTQLRGSAADFLSFLDRICKDMGVETEEHTVCAFCANRVGTLRCARCRTRYCGKTCQIFHWKDHAPVCGRGALADADAAP